MGFNISGIVINKNYKENFEELQKELGWNLIKSEDINFETAFSNWKDEGICDVYFTDKGTLLFINMDMCTESFPLSNANTLTFALSETSMAFNLNYCEKGVEKRAIMEVEDKRFLDEGEKLEVEDKSDDMSVIIWNQIEVVFGKRIFDIDFGEKAERYLFTKNEGLKAVKSVYNINEPISKDDLSTKFSDNELFNYFDEIIEFAQTHNLNAFLHPWAHKDNGRKFMNLFAIITEISNRPNLKNQITDRMPLERFKLLCKFDPEKVDSKTNRLMLEELQKIRTKASNSTQEEKSPEKKWWQFWQ